MPMRHAGPAKGVRSYMVSRTINAAFAEHVRRGEYAVDAHAVAEAMIMSCSGIFMSAGVIVTPARIAFTVIPEPSRPSSIAS